MPCPRCKDWAWGKPDRQLYLHGDRQSRRHSSNTLAVTINGANDAPVLAATTVNIAEGSAVTSGTLPMPTDADVHDVVNFTPLSNAAGSYGTFSVDANGNYTYVLNTSLPRCKAWVWAKASPTVLRLQCRTTTAARLPQS